MGKSSGKKKKGSRKIGVHESSSESSRIGLTKKNPTDRTLHVKYYLAALVFLTTFLVYLKSLQNEFVDWDDSAYVVNNPHIHSFNLTFVKWAFFDFYASNWHPFTWLSHAFDYAVWGLNPRGHHLTNNILHAFNTLLVVLLAMRLIEVFKKISENNGLSQPSLNDRTVRIAGTVTGLLFGLHPLHVESVAWIAERKDLLCAFFFLSTIVKYTVYVSEISANASTNTASRFFNKNYLFAIGYFVLALLSKPMAVTLPFTLLILDWYLFRRIQSLKTFWIASIEKLPFLALTLISSVVTILAHEAGGAIKSVEAIPLQPRVVVAAKSLIAYLVKMVLPFNLLPFYPYPRNVSLFSLENIMPIVIVIVITTTCVAVARKEKFWMAVWTYYVITLIPVLGIVQTGDQAMADRYSYLSSLGPFFVIGLIAAEIYEKVIALNRSRRLLRVASFFVALIILVSLSFATIEQIGIWNNSIVLWKYVVDKEPGRVALAHNNLGYAYFSKGHFDMAIEQYQSALKLKPDYAEAHNNLGNAYFSKGHFDMAIEQYQSALKLKPDYAEAHNNLGNAYFSKGRFDMAIEQYQSALKLKPDYAEAHNNLGGAYFSKGRFDMAIEQYQSALKLKPDYAEARNNLNSIISK